MGLGGWGVGGGGLGEQPGQTKTHGPKKPSPAPANITSNKYPQYLGRGAFRAHRSGLNHQQSLLATSSMRKKHRPCQPKTKSDRKPEQPKAEGTLFKGATASSESGPMMPRRKEVRLEVMACDVGQFTWNAKGGSQKEGPSFP